MDNSIGRNIIAVYLANFGSAFFTFLFWVITSNLVGSEIIGTVAAIGSFAMILGVLSNFDIGIGMKRFLGKAIAENNFQFFKNLCSTAFVFTIITSAIILIIAFNPIIDILQLIGIDKAFIPIIAIIVIGNNLQHVIFGSLVSAKKSKSVIIPSIVSSLSRFPVLAILIYFLGTTTLTVAWSYSVLYLVLTISLLIITIKYLNSIPGNYFEKSYDNLKLIIKGSFPRWIPQIIVLLGTQVGVLIIFNMKGPEAAGLFYIPFAIMNVLFLIPHAINQVIHPIFSGIGELDSQLKYLKKTLKIAFFGTLPFAAIMYFYSGPILSIFGKEFIKADNTFSILLLGFPVAIIADAVFFLLYARGNYKQVLTLGLIANIPRIVLYIILVPEFGGVGGATAYVIGMYCQFFLTIFYLEKLKIIVEYKNIS